MLDLENEHIPLNIKGNLQPLYRLIDLSAGVEIERSPRVRGSGFDPNGNEM